MVKLMRQAANGGQGETTMTLIYTIIHILSTIRAANC